MRIIFLKCFQISDLSLSVKLPSTVLRLKWLHVTLVELSKDDNEPCMFLTLKKAHLKPFHFNLGLLPGKYPCYNPTSSGRNDFYKSLNSVINRE